MKKKNEKDTKTVNVGVLFLDIAWQHCKLAMVPVNVCSQSASADVDHVHVDSVGIILPADTSYACRAAEVNT